MGQSSALALLIHPDSLFFLDPRIEATRTPYANVPGFEYFSTPDARKSRSVVLRFLIVDVSVGRNVEKLGQKIEGVFFVGTREGISLDPSPTMP